MDMSLSKLWEMVKDREAGHSAVLGVTKNQTQLSDWTARRHLGQDFAMSEKSVKKKLSSLVASTKEQIYHILYDGIRLS